MLGMLLDQVKSAAIGDHAQQPGNNFDSNGLMSTIEGLFGQHAQNTGQVLGSSQDPYGDPANQGGGGNSGQHPRLFSGPVWRSRPTSAAEAVNRALLMTDERPGANAPGFSTS